MRAVKYGDYDMQDNGVTVTGTSVLNPPSNTVQADNLAERDGALVVQQRFESKTFTVEGVLKADTPDQFDVLRDTFKLMTAGTKSQPFDISYAGGVRRYLATPQNLVFAERGNTTAGFSLQFLSPDGMGWDINSSDLILPTAITASGGDIPLTVEGTYRAEPIITVTVNTVTGGTGGTITLGNAVSLRSISITRNWVAGDVIEMDTLKGQLLVNGIAVEYTGQLLRFAVGAGGLTYIDTFSARDVTITSSYTRRWL